ncbi:MAG: hypothetical protein PHG89_11645 [Gallionella sp.]|nr:hypothetical protein [Gallionella sp.]
MDWLSTKLDNVLTWFASVLGSVFSALIDLLRDFVVFVLDSIFNVIVALFSALPVPSFMAANQLSTLFSVLPPTVIWLLSQTGVFEGFAVLGAGVAFNLLRKIVTLGQW